MSLVTLLNYYGSKAMIAPWIISNFHEHHKYVEPFCGSATILIKKPKSAEEVISDIYAPLINFHQQVRDNHRLLRSLCRNDFSEQFFHRSRKELLTTADPIEQARMFYTISRQSFRGLMGTATWDWIKGPSHQYGLRHFEDVSKRLQDVEINCLPYLRSMLLHDAPGVMFYLDPPYLLSSRTGGKQYKHEMTEAQHLRLLQFIKTLKGYVMISGYSSKLYNTELKSWHRKTKKTRSMVANQSYLPERIEVIWCNY